MKQTAIISSSSRSGHGWVRSSTPIPSQDSEMRRNNVTMLLQLHPSNIPRNALQNCRGLRAELRTRRGPPPVLVAQHVRGQTPWVPGCLGKLAKYGNSINVGRGSLTTRASFHWRISISTSPLRHCLRIFPGTLLPSCSSTRHLNKIEDSQGL